MSSSENTPLLSGRLASGIPGLDEVLGGGLRRAGIYLVMGPPGAGKTLLANQVCFHQARQGMRSLYVTLLAEPHVRMLEHLEPMRFFEPRALPDTVCYVSAFQVLESQGLHGLQEMLRREMRQREAGLLVIDGLVQAQEQSASPREFKKFIHELQTAANLARFTALLLSTSGTESQASPEQAMVDGIIELHESSYGVRAHRELRVRKFRGGENLPGRHVFRISDAGLEVFPRLESRIHRQQPVDPGSQRVRFGIPSLDAIFSEGLAAGSTTLLLGPTGSGKTLLGLSLLAEGLRQGEPCLYFGFYEPPDRLMNKAAKVGIELRPAAEANRLSLQWQPPGEYELDVLASRLLAAVKAHGARRVFVDGLSAFFDATTEPARLSLFFAGLTHELRCLGATTAFALETSQVFGPELPVPVGSGISAVAENLFFLRHVELRSRLHRLVSVLKVRDCEYDTTLREFTISSGSGIAVQGPFEGGEAMLTGVARQTGGDSSRE
ncbi:ATPase domain-containing protein [Hyalangium versicolor]|uniref:ATPase domain-containing protein n=1 Tax=Hyalangium versicolor TaxID=2861190 RepID=UPI001CCBD7C6|nr:ATPase domain-containing protein [Hyalangium versicolor]